MIVGHTGIGVFISRKDALDALPPWQGGGKLIADVTFERTVFQPAPPSCAPRWTARAASGCLQ